MKKFVVCVVLSSLLAVSYAPAAIFSDGFESGMGNWTQDWTGSNDMITVEQDPEGDAFYAYEGQKMATSLTVNNWQKSVMSHSLGDAVSGATVTMAIGWNFRIDYGSSPATKPAYVEVSAPGKFALFTNMYNPATGKRNLLGYRLYDSTSNTGEVATAITLARDIWYEAKFVTDAFGIKGYWNGQLIFSSLADGGFTGIKGIAFGSNSVSDPVSGASMSSMFVDDVSVVIPEPATMAILGLGGLLLRRKK